MEILYGVSCNACWIANNSSGKQTSLLLSGTANKSDSKVPLFAANQSRQTILNIFPCTIKVDRHQIKFQTFYEKEVFSDPIE